MVEWLRPMALILISLTFSLSDGESRVGIGMMGNSIWLSSYSINHDPMKTLVFPWWFCHIRSPKYWIPEIQVKEKWSESTSHSVVSNSLWPRGPTIACQAPLSMEFSRQEYWSGLPFPSPGDLSNPGIKPGSPALQVDPFPPELPRKSVG